MPRISGHCVDRAYSYGMESFFSVLIPRPLMVQLVEPVYHLLSHTYMLLSDSIQWNPKS